VKADVREFGAVGDGMAKDTAAIQAAIDACHGALGGTVVIREGVFVTGTLYLRSHVTIRVDSTGVLLGSPDITDYATDTHQQRYRNESQLDRCLIYAEDADSISLTGTGEINGNSVAFPNAGDDSRPMLIRMLRCTNVRLNGLRLLEAAAWTTAFLDSSYIWVDGVHIHNENRYNGDGLDFDGCSHVWISNSRISGTDDNLCLQASSRDYPVTNIHITNCEFRSLCAGIRIGLKSIGDIRDVVIGNCTMIDTWREGVKIESTEGGAIENISVSNIVMRNVRRPIFMILNNRFEPDDLGSSIELDATPPIGLLRNIVFSNITALDGPEMGETQLRFGNDVMGSPRFNGIRIDAEAHHPIEDVTIRGLHYTSFGGVSVSEIPALYPPVVDRLTDPVSDTSSNYYPDWSRAAFMDVRNVRGLILDQVVFANVEPDEREPYLIEGCTVRKAEIYLA
jgi:hypothetical protein